MNISFSFSIFKDFSSGSVWELYLLSVMILIALFCNFTSLCVLKPHSKILLLNCGAISELREMGELKRSSIYHSYQVMR